MYRLARAAIVLACMCALPGCVARQIAKDGKDFRQSVLDLYTDQVMDNLIRAHNKEVFVQLAFRDLIVQDFGTAGIDGTNEYLDQNVRTTGPLAQLVQLVHTYSNKFTFKTSGRIDKTVSFKADPVINRAEIYDYYIGFASDPGLFVCSDCRPKCPVHIWRKCGRNYYWVPLEAAGVFQQLVLKTTLQGTTSPAPPVYWETTVLSVEPRIGEDGNPLPASRSGVKQFVITFDKPIPNADGFMNVTLDDGRKTRLPLEMMLVLPLDPKNLTKREQAPPPGTLVQRLYSAWNPATEKLDFVQLQHRPAKVYSYGFPPPPPAPPADLQRLQDSLESIRLNLLNLQSRFP